jgi:hypothetical protein
MRLQVFLGLALIALTYLGLTEGSPSSTWGGRSEVPSSLSDTLVGGAPACPSFSATVCSGDAEQGCPGSSYCLCAGNEHTCIMTHTAYCGCTKSCAANKTYYTTDTGCSNG